MKTLSFFLLGTALFVTTARADDKKDSPSEAPKFKVVVTQLEEAWGTKVKSADITNDDGKARYVSIKVTLEFTKDVTDLEGLKKTFAIKNPPFPQAQLDTLPLVFHLFDAENVSLGKYTILYTEGDLTGVKGDAFRIIVGPEVDIFKKAAKLEARLKPAPKAAKKD